VGGRLSSGGVGGRGCAVAALRVSTVPSRQRAGRGHGEDHGPVERTWPRKARISRRRWPTRTAVWRCSSSSVPSAPSTPARSIMACFWLVETWRYAQEANDPTGNASPGPICLSGDTNARSSGTLSSSDRKLAFDLESEGRDSLRVAILCVWGPIRRCGPFSPDGKTVLTTGDDNTLLLLDTVTARPIGRPDDLPAWRFASKWPSGPTARPF